VDINKLFHLFFAKSKSQLRGQKVLTYTKDKFINYSTHDSHSPLSLSLSFVCARFNKKRQPKKYSLISHPESSDTRKKYEEFANIFLHNLVTSALCECAAASQTHTQTTSQNPLSKFRNLLLPLSPIVNMILIPRRYIFLPHLFNVCALFQCINHHAASERKKRERDEMQVPVMRKICERIFE
jgi:hypothetical protein